MEEVKEKEPMVLNEYSDQDWLSIKEYVPKVFSTRNIKGDYHGRYWCIVERPYKEDINSLGSFIKYNHSKQITRNVELCYWNNLANMFQDEKNEWVKVTHWCPIAELPKHNIVLIDRELINDKNYEIVNRNKQSSFNDISGMWDVVKRTSLYTVSLTETVYLSTILDENGLEDCIWCIKK